jgi:hypothetical protein
MSIDLGDLFKKALKDERKLLRPYFFAAEQAEPAELVTEEVYIRLRLARMFLKHRRVLFQTKYPVVNALMRFAGMNGKVEVNFVAKPELAGDSNESRLDDIVTLDQTLLGPVLYRGGDLELMLGLYAAPADDWAKRFISLAEGISQLTLNATLTTAISMASTIKTSIENSMSSDGLDLKLGLDKELKENVWLAPGHLVMISAPDDSIDVEGLEVRGGELFTSKGDIYTDHDYIVLAIEVTSQRTDWQSLGYGPLWQDMLKTAAEADDIETVKSTFVTFSGAVLASQDLSWSDRSAIVTLAKQRIKAIRESRAATDFFDGLKDADSFLELERLLTEEAVLPAEVDVTLTPDSLLQTDWIG